jgi:hypothetical protein
MNKKFSFDNGALPDTISLILPPNAYLTLLKIRVSYNPALRAP